MPRDANGVYSLPPAYLAVTGSTITALQHNSPLEDLASAITASLPRNGAAPMQGTLRINNADPTIALQDVDGRTGFLYANAGVFYVLRGAVNGTIWDAGPNGRQPLTINLETGDAAFSGSITSYGESYNYGDYEVQGNSPTLWLHYPAIKRAAWQIRNDSSVAWVDQGGQDHFVISAAGVVWTQQFGDLSTRIEDRAAAYASARVAKTGDTMTGNLTIQNATPAVGLLDSSNGAMRSLYHDGGLIGLLGSDGGWKLRVDDAGAVWTAQWGDLSTRIESRAAAYAGERVARTGDVMTGDLEIHKDYPTLWLHYSAIKRAAWQIRNDSSVAWVDQGGQDHFVISAAGVVWTQQFGDLSTRIESRADSWSATRREEAKSWAYANLIQDIRLAGGGDVAAAVNAWAGTGWGDVITGIHWSSVNSQVVDAARVKSLQALRNGSWFTIGTI